MMNHGTGPWSVPCSGSARGRARAECFQMATEFKVLTAGVTPPAGWEPISRFNNMNNNDKRRLIGRQAGPVGVLFEPCGRACFFHAGLWGP